MRTIKNILEDLKSFHFGLFFSLCLSSMIPAIYGTIRTFFLSGSIDVSQFDVLGQMEWFDLINETLLAFLTIPLYSILNKIYKSNREKFKYYVTKFGIVVFALYSLFSIGFYFFSSNIVDNMNVPLEIRENTYQYLRLETISFLIGVIVQYLNVVFVVLEAKLSIFILLILRLAMTVFSDYFLIPEFGIYGVPFSNIIVYLVIGFVALMILMIRKEMCFSHFHKKDLNLLLEWTKIGAWSGAQSFLDNFIYIIMVVKMVNAVKQQGNYWIANDFIWSWLLIPILALGEVIKADCKKDKSNIKQSNYYIIVLATVLLWLISIPFWKMYFSKIEKLVNYEDIFNIVIRLFGFYIAYALSVIPDNLFIGY